MFCVGGSQDAGAAAAVVASDTRSTAQVDGGDKRSQGVDSSHTHARRSGARATAGRHSPDQTLRALHGFDERHGHAACRRPCRTEPFPSCARYAQIVGNGERGREHSPGDETGGLSSIAVEPDAWATHLPLLYATQDFRLCFLAMAQRVLVE